MRARNPDVGRLLWVGFEDTTVSPLLRRSLQAGDVGGVTLFARNLPKQDDEEPQTDLAALRALNDELHKAGLESGERLLISVDQEGGRVQRVRAPADHEPPMYHFAQLPDEKAVSAARKLGEKMGADLHTWGFDIDFAPVLDLHTNPDNPIIGDRAFGSEPVPAATRALAFAQGLHKSGILSCGKHFPGHGDTQTDSHLTLPRLEHTMERLQAVELVPFAMAARARLPMIMTAHVVFSALDPVRPATLSPAVVTGILRDQLRYTGVIVSDDLDMKAIADNVGIEEAAVQAIVAGCDVLLLCRNPDHQERARSALHKEASVSETFREQVAAAAHRVRALAVP